VPRVLVREELNGTPTIAVYGPGLLYEVEASGVVRYYHYDETGSIIALTDASGLVATDRIGYGPFGTLVVRKGTTATPYLYGGTFGVETDPNGLLYMRARYYHPLLRQFISPDPVGFAGGLNWYVYAGHNPSQFGDPNRTGQGHSDGWRATHAPARGGTCGVGSGGDAGECPPLRRVSASRASSSGRAKRLRAASRSVLGGRSRRRSRRWWRRLAGSSGYLPAARKAWKRRRR
jgi:RHS repeat-associated protein